MNQAAIPSDGKSEENNRIYREKYVGGTAESAHKSAISVCKNKHIKGNSEKERIIAESRDEIPMKSMNICARQSATGAGKTRQAEERTAENGKRRKRGKHGNMYEDDFSCFHISSANSVLYY